jgi:hypothetical protein
MTAKLACATLVMGMLTPIMYGHVGAAEGHSAFVGTCFLAVFTFVSALKGDFSDIF